MKNLLIAALTLCVASTAYAGTDHYLRRDGNHVQHLKISRVGDDISARVDVDFEPNGEAEAGQKPCSADVSGEVKVTGENELTLREQIPGEAKYCLIKIKQGKDSAIIEQSPDCGYFAAGICHFDSEGKSLALIK